MDHLRADAQARLKVRPVGASEQFRDALQAPGKSVQSPLGWESEALTRALRAAQERRRAAEQRAQALRLEWLPTQPPTPGRTDDRPRQTPEGPGSISAPAAATVSLLPDLALALLREGVAAPGRVWLLLRHMDAEGAGWIELRDARAHLTDKKSPLRICGWRQLRNLLREGEPTFWRREVTKDGEERIWLRSAARVAAALQVTRLKMRPVAVPVAALAESIGLARAHFYATFHSARAQGGPIARETLERLSGVSPRTQRLYEERAGVERQRNWALGPAYSLEAAQERAWRHGHAIFRFTDQQGRHGPAGASYLAWQLPNSYSGPHSVESRGRQKRLNRQLVDLFSKGITGNGKNGVDAANGACGDGDEIDPEKIVRCFYANGQQAVKGYNRDSHHDAYWQSLHPDGGRKQTVSCSRTQQQIWRTIPGEAYTR